MEEISSKETFFLDDNLQSNTNLNQIDTPLINKNNINIKNLWLKYHYKFITSIIIGILSMIGYLITVNGLFDISANNKNLSDDFNITNFDISNEACVNDKYITISEKNNYYTNINNFEYSRDLSIYLSKFSMFASLILIGLIYYIKWAHEKGEKPQNFFLFSSFLLCSLLIILEIIIFNIFLFLFLRIFGIINFLENNIENKCIILISWNYSKRVLKHLMKNTMVLELLKIINIQILVYLLKQLIVLNNYFYNEDNSIPNQLEKQQKDLNQSLFSLNT